MAVARRKLRRPWPEIHQALAAIRACCPPPRPLTLATHEAALGLAERYGFQVYDALIVAAALEAGCGTLFSEDMQDGQLIEGRLTIRNPFAAASARITCGNPSLPQVNGQILRANQRKASQAFRKDAKPL